MKKFFTFIAVAVMAFAAQADVLTVCDNGEYMSNVFPIYGLWADTEGTMSQMIYPAEMLAVMNGKQITEVMFYTLNNYYEQNGENSTDNTDYINFEGATVQLSLKEVEQNGYDEYAPAAVTEATIVATVVPEKGSSRMTFVLNEPFQYNGGNLMVECKIIATNGDWGTTYFWGVALDYNTSYYEYVGYSGLDSDVSAFLPKVSFTYEEGEVGPVDPTEQTAAPSSQKENYVFESENLKYNAYTVTLIETEPSTIYYRIGIMVDGDYVYGEWMEYTGEMNFTEEGTYMIEAYAVAENKLPSEHIWDGFTVSKVVDVEELMAGKTVASVRYFNAAGQEMQQANGLTIMVTTYTDGTSSAVKVVK